MEHEPAAAERHRQAHDKGTEDLRVARRVFVGDEMATRTIDIERVELGSRVLFVAGTERPPDLGENPGPAQVEAARTQRAVSREQLPAVPHAPIVIGLATDTERCRLASRHQLPADASRPRVLAHDADAPAVGEEQGHGIRERDCAAAREHGLEVADAPGEVSESGRGLGCLHRTPASWISRHGENQR